MRSAFGLSVQTPRGPRKSGMPLSVDIPAPVSTTTRFAASISFLALSRAEGITKDSFLDAVLLQRFGIELEAESRFVRHRELAVHRLRHFLPQPRRPRHVFDGEAVRRCGDQVNRYLRREMVH